MPYVRSNELSKTVDLKKKLVEVGTATYQLIVRQNGESRFLSLIKEPIQNRRSRVFVPMSAAANFLEKLREIVEFTASYELKNISEKGSPQDQTVFAKSAHFVTPRKRKYYFDVLDANKCATLRLSYVFGTRRNSIHVHCGALPSFIEILEKFEKEFPSLSLEDDYPSSDFRPSFGNNRGGSSFRGSSSYRGNSNFRGNGNFRGSTPFRGNRTPRGYQRDQQESTDRRAPRPSSQIDENSPHPKDDYVFKPTVPFKVVSEPLPTQIVSNVKKFTLEIVEGTNTFFRITEMINDKKKSTIHVPISVSNEFQVVIANMNKEYDIALKSALTKAQA
ncbi:hypothetical protein MXB_1665 [Myxobolus squamalis]|nr:hypothetical protein MXB_1665 [Myxobolus squamalis]